MLAGPEFPPGLALIGSEEEEEETGEKRLQSEEADKDRKLGEAHLARKKKYISFVEHMT